MKRPLIYFIWLSMILSSCTNNTIQEILFKPNTDPSISNSIEVDSFGSLGSIHISWKLDEAADYYLLYRKEDSSLGGFQCLYKGNGIEYADNDIESGKRYIYRLDKVRGNKIFESVNYGYGYASDCILDSFENNNNEKRATFLESDLECNLYYIFFKTNNYQLLDEDWFYIVIPPNRTACILISQENLKDTSLGATTDLCLQINEHQSVSVLHNTEYTIQNSSNEIVKKYFKIFPDTTNLSKPDGSSTMLNYKVSLTKIAK